MKIYNLAKLGLHIRALKISNIAFATTLINSDPSCMGLSTKL